MGKSFKAARAGQKQEPIEFDVEGEAFSVPRPLPGFILLDFANLAGAEGAEAVSAFANFFTQALSKEEYARFRKACAEHRVPLKVDSDDSEVGDDEMSLLAIAQYIIAEDTGHPTEQQSDSLGQPSASGTSSDTAA